MSSLTFSSLNVSRFNFIKRAFLSTLKDKLPRKLKRLIYLASLLAMIENIKDPSDEIIRRLDKLFRLANYDERSITFPMFIHSFIWKKNICDNLEVKKDYRIKFDNLVEDKLNKREFKELCEFFYKSTPDWLKYGSKQLMVNDLTILFRNIKTLTI